MIGLLSIDKQNFPLPHDATEHFITDIMNELTRSWEEVISSLITDEWTSFKDGLAILICTQLLSQTNKNPNINPLELLLTGSINAERFDIVRRTLKLFKDIGRNIPEPIWFEFLVLDSPKNMLNDILLKRISFEVYVRCATKVVPALAQHQLFMQQLGSHFDGGVKQDQFVSKLTLLKVKGSFHQCLNLFS